MELINSTRMVAGYTMAVEPSGREVVVVVVKGTFVLQENSESVQLVDEQMPLVMSDVFFGEPGRSAPRYESEFVLRKRRCDVLLDGSAHAPNGRPTTRTRVGIQIGAWSKSFTVVGDRNWQSVMGAVRPTLTREFERMPVNYDRAFGGTDDKSEDPSDHAAFLKNPSGRGFHKHLKPEWVEGSPLPNTEEDGHPVTLATGDYRPMAFGPIGRHWEPRYRFAGTYDQKWLDEVFPFLPADFDEQYFQAAPADQQIPHPGGGELVSLMNLTPAGRMSFVLPTLQAPIHFFPRRGPREDGTLTLDTVFIEPDLQRYTLTWRATRPLKKNIFEVAQAMVGRRSKEWWADREKPGFPIWLNVVSSRETERPDTNQE